MPSGQRVSDLVHRAIAADGHNTAAVLIQRASGQFGGVTGAGGEDDVGVEPFSRDEGPDGGNEPGIPTVLPGAGIEDEARFHAAAMTAAAVARSSRCAAMARLASVRASGRSASRHWRQTAP